MKKHLLLGSFLLLITQIAHAQSATILPNSSNFSNNLGNFINNSGASNAYGIRATMTNTSLYNLSTAIIGINNGTGSTGIGIWGSHAGNGLGVYGTTVNGTGVYGSSVNGTAVSGNASDTGTGVFAFSPNGISLFSSSTYGTSARIQINYSGNNNPALIVSTIGNGAAAQILKSNHLGNGAGLFVEKTVPYNGSYNSYPHAELEVRHPIHFSSGMTGLRIFNTGGNNNNWTFYADNSTGNLYLYSKGTYKGTFASSNGAYTAASDIRLKNNIQPYASTLNKLMKIGVKSYKLHHSDKTEVGLLAQEVLQYFPEVVYNNTNDNGEQFYSMDYSRVGVLAVSAIQEQQKQIDEQKTLIETLVKEVTELKALIKK